MAQFERVQPSYSPEHHRFLLEDVHYSHQYNHLYHRRLSMTKDTLRDAAKAKWGNSVPILDNVIDSEIAVVAEDEKGREIHSECILVGTVFKQLPQRPSVLDQFAHAMEGHQVYAEYVENITSEKDSLILEDETGRIALVGRLIEEMIGSIVTGVVVAVKGRESSEGTFEVSDCVFYGEADGPVQFLSNPTKQTEVGGDREPCYLLLVSGLAIGHSAIDTEAGFGGLNRQLLVDFVCGRLAATKDDKTLASRIARVIIAGDSIDIIDINTNSAKDRHNRQVSMESVHAMKKLDSLVCQLLGSCPVDLLPGEYDPVNFNLPQQPMHPCLFPHGARFNNLNLTTNPCQFIVNNKRILCHSGQPTLDLLRQIRPESNGSEMRTENVEKLQRSPGLQAMLKCVKWGLLAPTAPDSLACYPFKDGEPFVIPRSQQPDIMIAGNQACYDTALVQNGSRRMRLICLPCFHRPSKVSGRKNGGVVLVDLNSPDFDCECIYFDVTADMKRASVVEDATHPALVE